MRETDDPLVAAACQLVHYDGERECAVVDMYVRADLRRQGVDADLLVDCLLDTIVETIDGQSAIDYHRGVAMYYEAVSGRSAKT
jgi:hypothetical protein